MKIDKLEVFYHDRIVGTLAMTAAKKVKSVFLRRYFLLFCQKYGKVVQSLKALKERVLFGIIQREWRLV